MSNPPDKSASKSRIWTILACTIGTSIEWYDFYIYGAAAALVFPRLFFPHANGLNGILASYGIYGIGFVVRPAGAFIFGYMGDRIGRRPALLVTVLLMGIGTTLIGFLPSYDSIGILAPILLSALRLVQGLGAGGEFAGALLLTAELSHDKKGYFASFPAMAIDVAILSSAGVFAVCNLLPTNQLMLWGWRIPFLLGFPLTTVALLLRRRIEESEEFTALKRATTLAISPIRELISCHPKQLLIGLGANAIMNVGYVYQVFALSYLTSRLGVARHVALTSLMAASVFGGAASLLFGRASDLVGARLVMLFGSTFTALFAIPFFWLLDTRSPIIIALALTGGIVLGLRSVLGVQGAFYADLFPPRLRFSGIALSREMTSAFLGGPLPFVATWLSLRTGSAVFSVAALMAGLALMTAYASLAGAGRPRSK